MTRSVVAFGDIDFGGALYNLTDEFGNPLTDEFGDPLTVGGSLTVDPDVAFAALIRGSHTIATRVDVLFDAATVVEGVAVVGGSVTYDRTASILGSCSVQIADPLRVPVAPDDVLTPYGYELLIWRGVSVPGGQIMAPLGVFPIQRSSVDGVTLLSSITGQDRSKLVSDAIFEDTYQVASGTDYATAIETIIAAAVPSTEFLFPSTSFTTPLLTFGPDDNRWEAVQRMARSIGNEILFDGLGRCVMRSEPTFQDAADGQIVEGENMLAAKNDLDRGPAYNKVIATSSNSSLTDQFRGEAEDDDPSSPTYYLGPFGKKARRYSSPFLASNAQCDSAAAAVLASNLGVARSQTLSALADPRRETSDVILAQLEALGLDELQIVDALTIGLSATDDMSVRVRAQQVAS